jgi:hypothetical protein
MLTSRCACSNRLFFDSSRCVSCSREAGFCPSCDAVRGFDSTAEEGDRLVCATCGTFVVPCRNRLPSHVCNVYYCADADDAEDALCRYCRFTHVVPDLAIEDNLQAWRRLEAAKRRVMIGLERIGVQFGDLDAQLPLAFEFKSDATEEDPVTTGHAGGVITINTREADAVERERTRVEFGEPHRTLVGHFRHELGHYFWDVLIKDAQLEAFRQVFGDESQPDYATAQQNYYQNGPRETWQASYVSAYASMHPWEDFAETFGTYLDLRAVLGTAVHFNACPTTPRKFSDMLKAYQEVGVMANEWNRDMGLLDLVPEVFVEAVAEKLRFMHELLAVDSAPG